MTQMKMSLPIGASKIFARPPAKDTPNTPWAERLYWAYLYFEVNYIPFPNTRILVYFFHCAIWDQVIPKMWLTDFGLIKNPPHNTCSRSWIPTYNAAITVTWARRMIPGWWNRVRAYFKLLGFFILLHSARRIDWTMAVALCKSSPLWWPEWFCIIFGWRYTDRGPVMTKREQTKKGNY